ncbi:YbaN family protein [Shewanella eurypsychrophilus]|uniref:Inner membrane protein n=2 Tax=Shewanellaceae TaxID=267890 RepID=A0ABX6VE26_9GAMM|nr:DUF454 family protein [Shewanella sp. YLB-09]QPG60598.1 YbaN family protein [Shewanella eurypsychrophilus]
MLRPFLLVLGGVSLGFAVIGVVLPVFPTVPFLLLSLWCFSHASPRMQQWLLAQRHFGPTLDNLIHRRGLTQRQLFHCLVGKWFGMGLAIYFVPVWYVKVALLAIAMVVTLFLLRMPRLSDETN